MKTQLTLVGIGLMIAMAGCQQQAVAPTSGPAPVVSSTRSALSPISISAAMISLFDARARAALAAILAVQLPDGSEAEIPAQTDLSSLALYVDDCAAYDAARFSQEAMQVTAADVISGAVPPSDPSNCGSSTGSSTGSGDSTGTGDGSGSATGSGSPPPPCTPQQPAAHAAVHSYKALHQTVHHIRGTFTSSDLASGAMQLAAVKAWDDGSASLMYVHNVVQNPNLLDLAAQIDPTAPGYNADQAISQLAQTATPTQPVIDAVSLTADGRITICRGL